MSPDISSRPRCLVDEDQALIGLLLEDSLADKGIAVVGPFASCSQALRWLGANPGSGDGPDLALADDMLSDGPCLDLARELKRRGVPFAALSGYGAAGGRRSGRRRRILARQAHGPS
ncbi:MAG TPA: histidine kinase [Beijerinckiaceae bacterium]|jgi:DNA-binding response OmpR family regulator